MSIRPQPIAMNVRTGAPSASGGQSSAGAFISSWISFTPSVVNFADTSGTPGVNPIIARRYGAYIRLGDLVIIRYIVIYDPTTDFIGTGSVPALSLPSAVTVSPSDNLMYSGFGGLDRASGESLNVPTIVDYTYIPAGTTAGLSDPLPQSATEVSFEVGDLGVAFFSNSNGAAGVGSGLGAISLGGGSWTKLDDAGDGGYAGVEVWSSRCTTSGTAALGMIPTSTNPFGMEIYIIRNAADPVSYTSLGSSYGVETIIDLPGSLVLCQIADHYAGAPDGVWEPSGQTSRHSDLINGPYVATGWYGQYLARNADWTDQPAGARTYGQGGTVAPAIAAPPADIPANSGAPVISVVVPPTSTSSLGDIGTSTASDYLKPVCIVDGYITPVAYAGEISSYGTDIWGAASTQIVGGAIATLLGSNRQAFGYGPAAGNLYPDISVSVSLDADRLILVAVANTGYFPISDVDASVGPPPVVTGCGLTWETVATQPIGGASDSRWTVYRAYTTGATSGVITATMNPGYNSSYCHIHVVQVEGTPVSTDNGADLIAQAASAGVNTGSFDVTYWWTYMDMDAFTSPANGTVVFGFKPGGGVLNAGVPYETTDDYATLVEYHTDATATGGSIVFSRESAPPTLRLSGTPYTAMYGAAASGAPPMGLIALEITALEHLNAVAGASRLDLTVFVKAS